MHNVFSCIQLMDIGISYLRTVSALSWLVSRQAGLNSGYRDSLVPGPFSFRIFKTPVFKRTQEDLQAPQQDHSIVLVLMRRRQMPFLIGRRPQLSDWGQLAQDRGWSFFIVLIHSSWLGRVWTGQKADLVAEVVFHVPWSIYLHIPRFILQLWSRKLP